MIKSFLPLPTITIHQTINQQIAIKTVTTIKTATGNPTRSMMTTVIMTP
jgi:hypothetical protein